MPPNTGSVISSDSRAAAQAKSIGATIGGDGWWYKDGKRLSTKEADELTRQAGTAITSTDNAHGERARDFWGKGSDLITKGYNATGLNKIKIGGAVGDIWERNKYDIAAGAGALAMGNPFAGAAIKAGLKGAQRGATGLSTLQAAREGYNIGDLSLGAQKGFQQASTGLGNQLANTAKGAYAGGRKMAQAPSTTTLPDGDSPVGFFSGLGSGLRKMFTGGEANKKTPWENALAVGAGAYNAYSGYKKNQAVEDRDKRMGDYYHRTVDQREAESLRNYGLDAAKEARDARIQSLSEEDRKRILMIMQNRDAELSPVREQLMKAIMGGDSTLFGGSVMKGLGSKGYI